MKKVYKIKSTLLIATFLYIANFYSFIKSALNAIFSESLFSLFVLISFYLEAIIITVLLLALIKFLHLVSQKLSKEEYQLHPLTPAVLIPMIAFMPLTRNLEYIKYETYAIFSSFIYIGLNWRNWKKSGLDLILGFFHFFIALVVYPLILAGISLCIFAMVEYFFKQRL